MSPIVYLEKYSIARKMRALMGEYYSPIASIYHYLHMAQRNYREYLKGEAVRLKKYFYVLRPDTGSSMDRAGIWYCAD